MVTDPSAERIDKYIGDEPPGDSQAICRNCYETWEDHHHVVISHPYEKGGIARVAYELCIPLADLLDGLTFDKLTDDEIASMRADEEYSRRKDEGLL